MSRNQQRLFVGCCCCCCLCCCLSSRLTHFCLSPSLSVSLVSVRGLTTWNCGINTFYNFRHECWAFCCPFVRLSACCPLTVRCRCCLLAPLIIIIRNTMRGSISSIFLTLFVVLFPLKDSKTERLKEFSHYLSKNNHIHPWPVGWGSCVLSSWLLALGSWLFPGLFMANLVAPKTK